jgi:NAD(P) transhydrogenase subunit alpha
MLKDNIITIDWTDEVLSKTVLTHAGKMHAEAIPVPKPAQPAAKVA